MIPDGKYKALSFFRENDANGMGVFEIIVKNGIVSLVEEGSEEPWGLLQPSLLQKLHGDTRADYAYNGTIDLD